MMPVPCRDEAQRDGLRERLVHGRMQADGLAREILFWTVDRSTDPVVLVNHFILRTSHQYRVLAIE
jgi:hypothetical protein